MNDKLRKDIIMIAALYIIPLTGLSIDIYVPSLPAVTSYFATSHLMVQNTISIYILGLGVSQLICGNIIDYYGRRLPLLISLSGYFLLSVLIILSKSIHAVTYLRFAQGICMGFSAVSARSIFLDLYSGEEYYKKASYMTIAYAIGPIIAPAIGGYLQHHLGWQSCFYFLLGYSLLGLIIVFRFIPETIQVRSPLQFSLIIHRYKEMLANCYFLLGLICLSMLNTILMLFNLIGPFIVQGNLHYSPVVFGQMALGCGLSWFAGNLMNRVLIHVSREKKITIALEFALVDILIMLILAKFWFNLVVIIIPVCLLLVAASVIFSNYFVHTPTLFPKYAATAAAFMAGSFALFSSVICTLLSKILTTASQLPLAYGYLGLVVTCILSRLVVKSLSVEKQEG